MKKMNLKIEMTTEMLGTWPGNPDVAKDFIMSKNPNGVAEDETTAVEDMEETLEKAKTVFLKENGKPYIMDYMLKGFLKSAALTMIDNKTYSAEELKAINLTKYSYKRTIDGQIFFNPRKIFLNLPDGGQITDFQRTIRVEGPRGERVALACSEMVPIGTWFECQMTYLDERLEKILKDFLDYGQYRGLGQFRNGGFGQFKYTIL